MSLNKSILIVLVLSSSIWSCDFISRSLEYRQTTEEFTEALLERDFDKCIDLFALDHEIAQNIDVDTIRARFPNFRELIVNNFGEELQYTFMSAEKIFSTEEGEGTPPNTTTVQIQVENDDEFGILKLLFDDISRKILHLNILNVKEEIPNMVSFWLFGLFAICVPIFNIYVIYKIRRSDLEKKWLKYVTVLLLNVPAITYTALGDLTFELLSFQVLLGITLKYMGYVNSLWAFGIPLGGLYWLWKLRNRNQGSILDTEITNTNKM